MVAPASWASGLSFCTACKTWGRMRLDMNPPIVSLTARVLGGGGESGGYFPDNTPCANGDHTICEMPFSRQTAMTFFSGSLCSIEYWGWLETNRATFGMASESAMFCGDHSLNPR